MTAITILLPDLLKYNYTLLSNFSKSETFTRLKKFQESTLKLLQGSIITGTPDEEGQVMSHLTTGNESISCENKVNYLLIATLMVYYV